MDDRWSKIERLYHAALEREESERAAFLAEACARDESLRREVESLLAQDNQAGSFLESPAIEVAAEEIVAGRELPDPSTVSLQLGTMVAHYRLTGKLGAGGMGEVYRARDTKLQRDVALKVLPDVMARDAQRMARFEREAQVLASLNHPNIAAIHGLEESNGIRALVMELVEGETLAERLGRKQPSVHEPSPLGRRWSSVTGPGEGSGSSRFAVDDALPIAKQIAEALEYAHEHGVVHRDLKPANIKITPEGTVKVLDFGLAKVLSPQDSPSALDPANSPTLSTMATQAGMILGTASYMSPEQAKGQRVDRRADIWAFGSVLYEMLSGRKAFEGETIQDVLVAVLTKDPDWRAIPEKTQPSIQKLIHRCLQKDFRRRLQAIGDARITIEDTLTGDEGVGLPPPPEIGGPPPVGSPFRRALPWAAGIIAGAFGVGLIAWHVFISQPPSPLAISTSIVAPAGTAFRFVGAESGFALSPDGQRMAYIAANGKGETALWVRPLSSRSGEELPGTEGAASPFWSPDSKFIGYFAQGKLKKVAASGGSPVTICESWVGGTWNHDGDILFSRGRIYRVSAEGGTTIAVTQPDAERKGHDQVCPFFLPDGRHFLYVQGDFYAPPESGIDGVFVGSLDSKESKFLVKATSGAVYASGYLFFLRGTTLTAQRFDPWHLQLKGHALPVAENVRIDDILMSGTFSVSENGLLAYAESSQGTGLKLAWFDRNGKQLGAVPDKYAACCPQLSPDGSKVVYDANLEGKRGIWVYDFTRGTKTRLTFGTQSVATAVWSPDGRHLLYSSNRNGKFGIYEKAADGSGAEKVILPASENGFFPYSWSRDGKFVVYGLRNRVGAHLWILPLTGGRKPFPFTHFTHSERDGYQGVFSPDGKWVAYPSFETGRFEIYAAAFPGAGIRYQISSEGGAFVEWGRNGKEIFYISADNRMMDVPVIEKGNSLEIGVPRSLFEVHVMPLTPTFDVTPDGRRFIVATFDDQTSPPITLVVNWPALLKKR